MRSFARTFIVAVLLAVSVRTIGAQSSSQVAALYKEALAREATLRKDLDREPRKTSTTSLLTQVRTLVGAYKDMWRLFPTSGYSDNALWQGATLSADAFWEFGTPTDRATALRMLHTLVEQFPTSSLLAKVPAQVKRLDAAAVPAPGATPKPAPKITPKTATASITPQPRAATRPARGNTAASAGAAVTAAVAGGPGALATLTEISRDVLPEALRVTIAVERETPFRVERIDDPARIVLDLARSDTVAALANANRSFPDDVVKRIRVGSPAAGHTRVAFDLRDAARYSVYPLYNPYRIVIDFERPSAVGTAGHAATPSAATPKAATPSATVPATAKAPAITRPVATNAVANAAAEPVAKPAKPASAPPALADAAPAPAMPAANSDGGFSLSRQLGLGIARIIIDPGHGGHDPGAKVKGLNEADLVLDVALRLETLLKKQPGVEVMLTRRTDTFVALEERTAAANRAGADLFLSIHANASPNARARGVETYFLNFATDSAAEAIAARENAGSARTMNHLPDIVKAIALNNKIDESHAFADAVQASLYDRLRKANRDVKNLGVKQAPFMVLIGATMPSVLAEISFLTNSKEGTLLRTGKYRQQIAEALYNGIMGYQRSLKRTPALASHERPQR